MQGPLKNQRGITLIELLIAFAIAAIVMMGVAAMIFSGLSLYGRNNANVEVQNEAQTSMNLILDTIMEAGGLCMKGTDALTENTCMILGKTFCKKQPGGYTMYASGSAIVYDAAAEEIYLISLPGASFSTAVITGEAPGEAPEDISEYPYTELGSGATRAEAAARSLQRVQDVVAGTDVSDRLVWLLAREVTGCSIRPAAYNEALSAGQDEAGAELYYFAEPYSLTVELHFERDYRQGAATRDLRDDAAIRNRMKSIYVTDTEALSTMKEYLFQK